MIEITCKDLRKAAFAVGLGFTVGKFVGKMVNSALNGAIETVVSTLATKGNETAQKICEKSNIGYKVEKNDDDEPKMRIGFI